MSARARLLAGGLVLLAWVAVGGPTANALLDGARAGRAGPPISLDVRARLALLPEEARAAPAVRRLTTALDREDELAKAEQTWNCIVGAALDEGQRQLATRLADVRSPSPPPPFEAPEADGDLVALARILLATYGYTEMPPPTPPRHDHWLGVDRRMRTRGVMALVNGPGLDEDTAHLILAATLVFLDAQLDRASNMAAIEGLLPVAMGQVKPQL